MKIKAKPKPRMKPKYTAQAVTGGNRTVIFDDGKVSIVFIEVDHAELAARVTEFLNRPKEGAK